MSWAGTYLYHFAIGLDQFAAAIFFNRNDVTISALCRIVQLAKSQGGEWQWKVANLLKLQNWQVLILTGIGYALNSTFSNHCEAARQSDLIRAASTQKLLV